jgi:hypothetical protein
VQSSRVSCPRGRSGLFFAGALAFMPALVRLGSLFWSAAVRRPVVSGAGVVLLGGEQSGDAWWLPLREG